VDAAPGLSPATCTPIFRNRSPLASSARHSSQTIRVHRRTVLQDADSFSHAGWGRAPPHSQPSLSSFLQRAGGDAARRPQPLVLPARTMPANNRLQQFRPRDRSDRASCDDPRTRWPELPKRGREASCRRPSEWSRNGRGVSESIGKTKHRRRVRRAHSRTHWAARTLVDAPFVGLDAVDEALSRRQRSLFGRSVMR